MTHLRASAFLALAAAAVFACAAPGALAPGSPAPKIAVKKWIKGKPVTSVKNGVYVVEFWATWCGPCVESIPHLSKLAKANPKAKFLGVGIWEDDKNGVVKKFVTKMGSKMSYSVAYGGNQEGMAKTWMEAAGQDGIPTAFLIKNGVIQWIGHPMELETPLKSVLKGSYNIKNAKAEFAKQSEKAEEQRKAYAELSKATILYDAGKKEEATTMLDKVEKDHPQMASEVKELRMGWLAKEDPAQFQTKIDEMLADKKTESEVSVASIAARLVLEQKAVDEGVKAIDKALASEKPNLITLYYGCLVYRSSQQPDKAKDAASKALKIMETNKEMGNENMKTFFEGVVKNPAGPPKPAPQRQSP